MSTAILAFVERNGSQAGRIDNGRDAGILFANDVKDRSGVSRDGGGVGDGHGSSTGSIMFGRRRSVVSRRLLFLHNGRLISRGRGGIAVPSVEDTGHGGILSTLDGGLGPAALADQHAGLGDGDGVVHPLAALAVLLLEDGVDDVELDLAAGGDRFATSHVFATARSAVIG